MKVLAILASIALAYAHGPTQNLVQLCESNPDLSILTAALVGADLTDTLSDASSKFTVFAPTNDAFNALPAGVLDDLMKPENKQQLVDILTYHVLPAEVQSTDLQPFQAVNTVEGKPVHVTKWGGNVRVGSSLLSADLRNVVAADNLATNGVAHVIDGVLLPPSALAKVHGPSQDLVQLVESVPNLGTLAAALVAADLVDTLSDASSKFTVFAPTDEAFNALPAEVLADLMKPENKQQLVDILTYHVLPEQVKSTDLSFFQAVTTVEGKPLHVLEFGGRVHVGPSIRDLQKVVAADNLATNGVAHIIDGVLLPPTTLANSHGPTQDLVELCQSTPDLSTLTAALVAADLVATLSDASSQFTVFAPTNDAFNALPAGVLDDLLKPENKQQLVDILTYHVLPEQVKSTDLSRFQSVTTVEGKSLNVLAIDGRVRVGPSIHDLQKVIAADNLATNGVAHIINGVLLPPQTLMV
jgi:transforming growth factor-beta-induced protein